MNSKIEQSESAADAGTAFTELMSVEDVARRLNVSDSFVYSLVANGRLKHYRLGKGQGGIRVSEAQLAAFLADTERGGQPTEAPKPVAPRRQSLRHLPLPS